MKPLPESWFCRQTFRWIGRRHLGDALPDALNSSVNIRRFTAILHLRSDHTELAEVPARPTQDSNLYSVHVRTRKFRSPAKTKRYVVPAPRTNSKTQGGTRSDSDSICHRHHSVFSGFQTV